MCQTNQNNTFNKSKSLEKQRGSLLIEGLGYLALVATLVGAAFYGISSAMDKSRINSLSADIGTINSAIVSSAAATGTYGSGSSLVEYLVRTNKVPSSLTVTGTAPNRILNHKLGGTVEITGRDNHFVVTVNDVPGSACVELFTNATAWNRVNVSSSSASSISVTSGGYTPPYSQITAMSACSESSLNRMHFIN